LGVFFNNAAIFFVGIVLLFTFLPSLLDVALKRQAIGNVEGERNLEKTKIFAGEPLVSRTTIRSGQYPLDVTELVDPYPSALKLGDGGAVFTKTGPDTKCDYSFQCIQRGRYKLGPLQLAIKDKFGYFSEYLKLAKEENITVYPPYDTIHKMELTGKGRQLGKLYGVHQTRQIGIGSEFHGIRKYSPTDEYRRIAWKHLARHGALMSKEFEGERNVTVLICIDCGKTMGIGTPPTTKLEYSIQAAMMICKMADEKGDSFGVVIFADKVKNYLRPGRGKLQFGKLLETLTDAGSAGVTSYAGLADYVCNTVRRTTLMILLSDFEGPIDDITLAVRKLRARGHILLAICPFTPYFEASPQADPALTAVSSALVAKLKREHMKQTRRELMRFGVDCIDVGPKDYLPIVAEKFLEKKKLGGTLL
jgi:uncharacterized protein (DUF58 family)